MEWKWFKKDNAYPPEDGFYFMQSSEGAQWVVEYSKAKFSGDDPLGQRPILKLYGLGASTINAFDWLSEDGVDIAWCGPIRID